MSSFKNTARTLATAFLAGRIDTDELVDRGHRLLGKRWRWIRPLAQRIVAKFGGQTRPRIPALTTFLLADQGFSRATAKHDVRVVNLLDCPPKMCPIHQASTWQVPAICSTGDLAEWLEISPGELEWFADLRWLEQKRERQKCRHYRYRPLAKRHGQIRLIEAPKDRLKVIQRQIQTGILDNVPPHEAAHGFRRGRSIKTFAQPHTNQTVVIKIDLQDFFPSISLARVHALFRTIGYPERVADVLTGLCINATPMDIWQTKNMSSTDRHQRQVRWLYAKPHLPQGAPTSPAIANVCAYRLDCRLFGLANAAGAVYTRYADDLAFSGELDFARVATRFQVHVCATVMEEGFAVHQRKTRIMRPGMCQRVAGVIVNKHLNLPRNERDRLKATLANCVRYGPGSQNRTNHADFRGHLLGRVSFVESINPNQGHKLRRLFDQIEW